MSTDFLSLAGLLQNLALPSVAEVIAPPMPRAQSSAAHAESFGHRMARLRKARGLIQQKLADRLGISRRMVAYYEGQTDRPPAHVLDKLAAALKVSADQLLGRQPSAAEVDAPFDVRVWRRLRVIEKLSPADRAAVIKYAEALARGARGHGKAA